VPRKTVAPPRSRQRAASAKTATPDLPLFALARQVRSWADTLLSVTGSAADIGLSLAQARVKDPKRKQAVAKAGTQLRRWREAAGMTARELSEAVGLGDAKLLEEAEGGVATLPFEIVLRLAGVLGRNDPIPVAMSLTRQYNPELWKTLESLGVGKLAVQGARERELANVYRGNDAARQLDDEDFAEVLSFTRRAFEMAVDYAKERHQFGQPIGRFQAIQHKLANNAIALEGVRLTLEHAAESLDVGRADAGYYVEAAMAYGAQALKKVSLETQHTFGAIGYAEEHEAPRHFRRAHLDVMVLGGGRLARRALASWLLDKPDAKVPEYDLGPAGNAFRTEVRQWLEQHWSGERKRAFDALPFHDREFDASFARDMGRTGWLGMGWPKAFGGQERTPLEQLGFMEVMERAEAPRIGASVQANAIMMFGTPEQQQRYLPEILRGEVMHGMGYSEPNSGSDLASLRTSAVLEGDHWVINGQKIWTTTWWGQYMFLAARTDRDAKPPHAGISMFIVPMDTPGITIHSAKTMYDGSFANIFYDNVRIPKENIVGPVNGGWKVLTGALANERGSVGGGIVLKVVHGFEALCARLRESPSQRDDAWVRDVIGELAADIEVGRRLMIHCAELAAQGTTPPDVGAMSKVFSGELMERYGELALELLGSRAALSQFAPGALEEGRFEQQLRHSLMWVISIGTNEIQRSLIAQRGLGLPR